MPWVWSESLRRYRDIDTGRILSFAHVQDLVNGIVDKTTGDVTDVLAGMLADGRLNVGDWKTAMGRTIKDAYVQQACLAAGGRSQMTQADWGVVGGTVREQYRYLDKFARQVASGALTPGQIQMRSRMYINSSREAFWRIQDRKERERGMREERWNAIGDDATCSPCAEAAAMDWQSMGTFAQPGSGRVLVNPPTYCEGLTNCRCTKEYR